MKIRKSKSALFCASTVTIWALGAAAAEAQATDATINNGIVDIVVTARKTSEKLQTTPVAITALNADGIRSAQITTVADLQKKAPALSVQTGGPGGTGTAFLAIRGQTNVAGNSTQDSAVATYVDGVYYARSIAGNLGIFDVSQAEVLRGPQGTLFGRNTTGGALNLTTTQPDGTYGGYLGVEYGNYNSVMIDGAVTIPLQGEALSLRAAGRYASHDGYYNNPLDNSEFNDLKHYWAFRGTLKWAPEDLPLTLSISADLTDWADSGQANTLVAYDPAPLTAIFTPAIGAAAAAGLANAQTAFLVGPGGGGKFDETYQTFPTTAAFPDIRTGLDAGRSGGVSATLNVEFGSWNLKSITAWRFSDANVSGDLDATPLPILAYSSPFRQDQYSQEFQANTTIGNLDLIAGLMYFYEKGFEGSVFTNGSPTGSGLGTDAGDYNSQSKSAYVQANYRFTEKLRGTAGFRYTWDERNLTRMGQNDYSDPTSCTAPIPLTASGCSLPLSASFKYPAWLVGLDYKLADNVFLYVKVSEASLSGGFNTREAPIGRESFEPEKRREVEIGAKLHAFDRRLRTNLAIFSGKTTGAQRQASGLRPNNTVAQFTQNAGDVETSGAELELTAIPWEGMEVNAGAAYLDASSKKGSFLEQIGPGVFTDRSGEVVVMAPKWSFNVGVTQKFNASYGVWSGHVDYTYFDDKAYQQSTAPAGAPVSLVAATAISNQVGIIPSYSLVNGKISLRLNSGLEFSLWGTNLVDEKYYNSSFPSLYTGLGIGVRNQGAPRTYGIGIRYDF